ncbi:xylulokinase [Sinanaerobacter sp. ZZT-01]|uniref:xylulokinase n=1 Tax=Sinanaerobacter sp. ZZT-01 TaxID=3111540 RepID=UPI002D7678E0|nr:xylulokinase [Sinanaerobacter sp. ZZT-01]WRR94521.1 xylulokinase [Sinanaerobacter sp. ZZT-01]
MEYLLGIDIGTSGTKTVLFDLEANAVASKTHEYPLYQEQNGWAEQEPEDWWEAVKVGIRSVLEQSGINAETIKGIGLSGQMHGLVMLDHQGNPLRKSIIWCDQRTGKEVEDMNRILTPEKILAITANPALTGFTAAKILWVKKNEPEIYKQCAHILLPKDYIRYKLTGEFATEVSDASGMQLMDVPKRTWSSEVLDAFGIDQSLLGKMYESTDVTGAVHKEAAEITGLAQGIIVVGGAGDNPAAAIGTGIVTEGSAFTTIGTSGVVYAISNQVAIDKKGRVHTLCASVPGKWTVMSCTQGAGLSLQWLRNHVCSEEVAEAKKKGVDPYEIMTDLASRVPIGANKLLYLPYLMGERSPHPDPDCRGTFFGLSAIHERAELIRAVLEGVAYSQLECVDVFREMGVAVTDMMICGGGARSDLWRQMFADLYQCPVSTIKAEQGGALGAAILAGVGAGVYKDLEETCNRLILKKAVQEPIAENSLEYQKYYNLYKELYVTLFASFKKLAAL